MDARLGMRRLCEKRRERGVCLGCGLEKPKPGKLRCEACLKQGYRYSIKYKKEHPEKVRAYQREYAKRVRAERLERHVCVMCGKNKPYAWRHTCNSCLQKRRESEIRRMIRSDSEAGDA